MGNVQPNTVEQLIGVLQERFGSSLQTQRAWSELRDIRIRANESVRNYAARFEALLNKMPRYEPE